MQSHLPQSCLVCGTRVVGALLCPVCAEHLPRLPAERCPQCALPSPGGALCGRCLKHPPAFQATVVRHVYGPPLDGLVRDFKYRGQLALADFFADTLAEELAGRALPDLILPMPLHESRLAERGFNQAGEIARRLAPRLAMAWDATACRRLRPTPPQAGLDLKARRRNLRGVFRCDLDLTGKRVALLDDVMTTGASLDELAREARRAGAVEISAWVVARTLARGD
ncbi:MAG: double zinc ribbon domain-containing protein [Pseudomonadota bacterium]